MEKPIDKTKIVPFFVLQKEKREKIKEAFQQCFDIFMAFKGLPELNTPNSNPEKQAKDIAIFESIDQFLVCLAQAERYLYSTEKEKKLFVSTTIANHVLMLRFILRTIKSMEKPKNFPEKSLDFLRRIDKILASVLKQTSNQTQLELA